MSLVRTLLLSMLLIGLVAPAWATTGLIFPRNDQVTDGTTVSFKFTDPQNNGLPLYGPSGQGVTYIWKIKHEQQTGYYTTVFWGNNDGSGQLSGFTGPYYGFHPYPPGGLSGITHQWEVAANNGDFLGSAVVKNVWYTQVARVWSDGSGKHHEFYWNWPSTTDVVTYVAPTSYGNTNPPFPALTFGDAPWRAGAEMCACTIRGIQIYNTLLSLSDISAELNRPQSTSVGAAAIWYKNIDPTPTDISDKSGAGHHPTWVGALRPTLFTDNFCHASTTEVALNDICLAGGYVKRAEDFERTTVGATYCDAGDPANFGWFFVNFPPSGSKFCGVALDTTPPAPGTGTFVGGVAGTARALTTGPWGPTEGQAYIMPEGAFKGVTTTTNGATHIWARRYIKKIGPFTNGGTKTFTPNPCCVGDGGIFFGGATRGGSGRVLLPPDGTGVAIENMLVVAEGANRSMQNVSSWSWTANDWWFEEIEIELNTPGVANGVLRVWMNNCGASGVCTGSPILRAQHTNVMWRNSGNNTNIGRIELANWGNPSNIADRELYDQIIWTTQGPIGFMGTTGSDTTPPAPPTGVTIQ